MWHKYTTEFYSVTIKIKIVPFAKKINTAVSEWWV